MIGSGLILFVIAPFLAVGLGAVLWARAWLAASAVRALSQSMSEERPVFGARAAAVALINVGVAVAAAEYGLEALAHRFALWFSDGQRWWLHAANLAQMALGMLALFAIGLHALAARGRSASR